MRIQPIHLDDVQMVQVLASGVGIRRREAELGAERAEQRCLSFKAEVQKLHS